MNYDYFPMNRNISMPKLKEQHSGLHSIWEEYLHDFSQKSSSLQNLNFQIYTFRISILELLYYVFWKWKKKRVLQLIKLRCRVQDLSASEHYIVADHENVEQALVDIAQIEPFNYNARITLFD